MDPRKFITYQPTVLNDEEPLSRSADFKEEMSKRRSIRHFSEKHVSKEIIQHLIMTAASAPSGANKQPWSFCAISSPAIKKNIREAAEKEEFINYSGRMSKEWLQDLEPLDTNWQKEFLEIAPWLIVVFKKSYDEAGTKRSKNYYVNESVGIAAGFLITAIHHAGLVTLTHTPSPMNFLQTILGRPENEKTFLLLPVGYPADDVQVPDIKRKSLNEVLYFYE